MVYRFQELPTENGSWNGITTAGMTQFCTLKPYLFVGAAKKMLGNAVYNSQLCVTYRARYNENSCLRVGILLLIYEYEEALAQPDGQYWTTIHRSTITPTFVEQRVQNFKYCAYHCCFHHVTRFGPQRLARPDKRYCDIFLAEELRASTVPSLDILESELYRMAKLMKVKVIAD